MKITPQSQFTFELNDLVSLIGLLMAIYFMYQKNPLDLGIAAGAVLFVIGLLHNFNRKK